MCVCVSRATEIYGVQLSEFKYWEWIGRLVIFIDFQEGLKRKKLSLFDTLF